MIALLAAIFFSAFPVRGSVWQSADSSLVVDWDTLHFNQLCVVGYCHSCHYSLLEANTRPLISTFLGDYNGVSSSVVDVVWDGSALMNDPAHPTTCTPQVRLNSPDDVRFRVHGTKEWAIWADSVQFTIRNGEVQKPVLVRWRWCRIDTAVPWVRWEDTIRLGPGESTIGLPILTTTRSVELGRMETPSQIAPLGLILRSKTDSDRSVDLGFVDGTRTAPTGQIPGGSTFRVLDAFKGVGGTIQWRFAADGKPVDSVKMTGQATTDVQGISLSRPVRRGEVGYEPSTGRRIRLESSMFLGKHLLAGPSGLRLIVVE